MAAVVSQDIFPLDAAIESSWEQHAMNIDHEAIELIELRYQGLWARVEMENVFEGGTG